jgi:hypothetical protein
MKLALELAHRIGWVQVDLFPCVSNVSADSLQCQWGKEGSRMFGFGEALPGFSVSPSSGLYAQEM